MHAPADAGHAIWVKSLASDAGRGAELIPDQVLSGNRLSYPLLSESRSSLRHDAIDSNAAQWHSPLRSQ